MPIMAAGHSGTESVRTQHHRQHSHSDSHHSSTPRKHVNATPTPGSSSLSSLQVYSTRIPQSYVTPFCGASAGVASGIVTCPLDVIKTKLQAQGGFQIRRHGKIVETGTLYRGMIGTGRMIWREEGVRGLYRGLAPMLLGYLPTWAVYLTMYDVSRDFYFNHTGTLPLFWRIAILFLVYAFRSYVSYADDYIHFRQLVAVPDVCVSYSGSVLHNCYKPDMGDQDTAHVAEPQVIFKWLQSTVELQKYLGCSAKDVHQRRHTGFLLRLNSCSSWSISCRHPIPSLRVLQNGVYWLCDGRISRRG